MKHDAMGGTISDGHFQLKCAHQVHRLLLLIDQLGQ